MRARACIKCKEYIVIHPDNPINQIDIKKFDRRHTAHTIMTVDLNEIKGVYAPYTNNGAAKSSEEGD